MLFTHENLRLANIKRMIFIDADLSEVSSLLLDFINPNEAIVLRSQDLGSQARTNWFRNFFDPYSNIFSVDFSGDIGIPSLPTVARGQFVLGENWNYVNTKKRVSRSLLDLLDYAKVGGHVFLSTRGSLNTQLKQRCAKVASILPEHAEIGIWVCEDLEPRSIPESLLQLAWNASFGGHYFRCFT
jgi:hypothetical protein